jgi:hypothetical protein
MGTDSFAEGQSAQGVKFNRSRPSGAEVKNEWSYTYTAPICLQDVCGGKLYLLSNTSASGFGGLGVACWPLVPKFAGSNPAEPIGFLTAKKIISTPSFGGEVKPSVPCRRFAACKRSLNVAI